MKHRLPAISRAALAAMALCTAPAAAAAAPDASACDTPLGAAALMKAYPGCIAGYADNTLIFADGSTMEYDDLQAKTFGQMLDNSDIDDMFGMRYTAPGEQPGYLDDAGRSRCEALFKKMYGDSEASVRASLVAVPWFGGNVRITSINGAADSLRRVYSELAAMPDMRQYLNSSGTFYWRKVRGASRLSAHSYGIAIDIGVDKSDYWKWQNPKAAETDRIAYRNRIPRQIVDAFERHGFIWGGAWYHYDTMHFEFRPEILEYRRLARSADAAAR